MRSPKRLIEEFEKLFFNELVYASSIIERQEIRVGFSCLFSWQNVF